MLVLAPQVCVMSTKWQLRCKGILKCRLLIHQCFFRAHVSTLGVHTTNHSNIQQWGCGLGRVQSTASHPWVVSKKPYLLSPLNWSISALQNYLLGPYTVKRFDGLSVDFPPFFPLLISTLFEISPQQGKLYQHTYFSPRGIGCLLVWPALQLNGSPKEEPEYTTIYSFGRRRANFFLMEDNVQSSSSRHVTAYICYVN